MTKDCKKLYGTYRWKKTRAAQLAKQRFCEWCLKGYGKRDGRTLTVATVCDHKIPCVDEKTFWGNELQSLCKTCHLEKGRTEDRAFHARRRRLTPVFW